jgi:hypothetical protein
MQGVQWGGAQAGQGIAPFRPRSECRLPGSSDPPLSRNLRDSVSGLTR